MTTKLGFDFFEQVAMPAQLKSSRHGVAYLVKQADIKENCYHTSLWCRLKEDEAPRQVVESRRVKNFWWLGDALIYHETTDGDLAPPQTVLHKITPGEAAAESKPWRTIDAAVQDIAPLNGDDLLVIAEHNAMWQQARQKTDSAEDAAAYYKNDTVAVVTEGLPFWRNGAGFAAGKTSCLYRWHQGVLTPLTDDTVQVENLTLSPCHRTAYYLETECDENDIERFSNRLKRLDTKTFEVDDLSLGGGFHHQDYAVLPQGGVVVYAADAARSGLNQNRSFYKVDSGSVTPLNDRLDYAVGDRVGTDLKQSGGAAMLAHGSDVFFVSTRYGASGVFALSTKTGDIRRLTSKKVSVQEIALCEERLFYTAFDGGSAQEVYSLLPRTAAPRTDELQPQSAFNRALAQRCAFQKAAPFSVINRHGDAVNGWVLKPKDAGGTATHPAVLYIHGGPKTAYGGVLFHELQLLCELGFGVFYCNPTGSDGQGDAFSDLRGRYATVDYDDVMQFTDAVCAANSWIDKERLGVCGGSYGGFLTNWIVAKSDRFAAAVSQRGISNWQTMLTMSDIGPLFVTDQLDAAFDDVETMRRLSPLFLAQHITTPLLLMHSEKDYRCPYAESLQLYTALKLHGKTARLCFFPDENHELSRSGKPQARVRRLKEIADWLTLHLKS